MSSKHGAQASSNKRPQQVSRTEVSKSQKRQPKRGNDDPRHNGRSRSHEHDGESDCGMSPRDRGSPSPHRVRDERKPRGYAAEPPKTPYSDTPDAIRFTADVVEGLKGFFGTHMDELKAVVNIQTQRLDAHDANLVLHDEQLTVHGNKIEVMFNRLSVVEAEVGKWKAEALRLGERVHQAETAEPKPAANRLFDRAPNPALLAINSKSQVPASTIKGKLIHLLENVGVRDAGSVFTIKVSRDGKHFDALFKGSPTIAAERVDKVLDSMRDDEGNWVEIFVGGGSDEDIQIYLGRDKSDRQKSTEIATKRLRTILAELHPTVEFFAKKFDGEIHSEWRPLAKVDVISKNECKLLWQVDLAAELGINRTQINEVFLAKSKSNRPPTAWSSS